MAQVSILEGVFIGSTGNYRPTYPINMQPVVGDNGFSRGFLRTAPGLTSFGFGPGADRGSIMWNGNHYRVMGTKLCLVTDVSVTVLGDVGGTGPVTMDYGFDRLAIASGGNLFYWNGAVLSQVVDPDLGTALDVAWIDGYYMTTDGTSLVVTDLADPMSVNPLKYGSSEADPDPILAVKRVRAEVYAVNANTIENFQNVGGAGFPFQRNPGGLIPKGACGTHAVTYFLDTLAFVGSGRHEALSVYIAGYGEAKSISTPEIDRQLQLLTLAQRTEVEVEGINQLGEQRLYVHTARGTFVYHHQASIAAGKPVWTQLAGGALMNQPYPARHFAYSGYGWIGGSPAGQYGRLDEAVETQFGAATTWQFDTLFLYNEGRGAILKTAELVGTPGLTVSLVIPGTAFLSWTQDGHTWSQEREVSLGVGGDYLRRIQWRPKTKLRQLMGLRFRGPAATVVSFGRLEVDLEPLNA